MEAPRERVIAFGVELIRVHQWLRDELARLRDNIGTGTPITLQAHCAAFCTALTRHHTSEDDDVFPLLADRFPELSPIIDKLREDHWLVADVLRRLENLPSESDIDGLAAILESHFRFEERQIVGLLDGLEVDEWHRETPAFFTDGG
ncbi:hemerythrin domain-containing protein [Fodinicola acaciae]|uniref:hemerythrin domain-containing protein n=1 Tax=Fodinicola acaciae TaxID=2681555 RepID=UPI0013D440AC|nr:hemerythrin domain-containing protein [Fodinicola acaciae]